MGLFDALNYDPQTYSAGGGGLIDRLLSQLGTQSQYQQAPGFQQSPMDANASAPAQSANAPIAVGNNYMMPRIGGGFNDPNYPYSTPQQGASEPQNAQASVPNQQPQPTQQQPTLPAPFLQPEGGGIGGAFRGLAANAHTGPIGMILGGIAGAAGMGQAEQHNAQLNAQYRALIAAGVPQQKALLATINPEFAKTIIPESLGKEKYSVVKTGQNGLGAEQYEVFNAATGEHAPIKPAAGADNGGGGLGNMDLTGKDYLASIPAAQRGIVQGMVEGTIQPPSSFALAKPYWVNMIAAAKNYDPTFDATQWGGRVAGVKDFSAGKSSEMVRSANQTLHHTGGLLDSIDALNNGNYPLINKAGNAYNEATGGGAPTAFRINAHAVAEEMSKVFKGANLSDTEIKNWEQNLSENMSPEQQRAAVGKLKDLLQGSLQALDEKRVASMGQMAADKAGPIIKPEGQKVLQRIDQWLAKGRQGTTPGAPATTKTGVSWSVE